MRKTILIQLVALFAFCTLATAQRSAATIGNSAPSVSETSTCTTNFDTTTPDSPLVRRIQVIDNADRDLGYCAFELQFFKGEYADRITSIKWSVDGIPLANSADRDKVAIPVKSGQTQVCVIYMFGNQPGFDCNTYLVK